MSLSSIPMWVFMINELCLSASCSLNHLLPPQVSQSSYIIQVTGNIRNTMVPDLAPGSAFKMVPYPLTCSHPSQGRPCGQTKEDISSCFPRSGFESFPSSDLKTAVTLRVRVPFTGERVLEIKAWMIGLLITTWNYCFWALLSRQSEVNISGFIHPSSYLSSVYTDASNMSLQGLL